MPDRKTTGSTGARRSLLPSGGAALAYVLLTFAMTWPLVTRFASAIPGDGFDGWQNYWNLWWVKVALVEQFTSPWFANLLYHPTGVSLLFHTLNVFNGVTFLPVQLALGLIPAYNAVVVFSFAAGGLGGYLLTRETLGPRSSRLAALTAGAIFTFSPYHFAHLLGHMQLIALEWLPFYALYLLRVLRAASTGSRPRLAREAALATLFLILVALCDWYYAFYCLVLTVVVFVVLAVAKTVQGRHATLGRGLAALAGVWMGAGLILSPLILPMVREARQADYMVPGAEQSRMLSADLLAFVTPQQFHPIWGEWAAARSAGFSATASEYTVFAGYTVLALSIVGLAARWPRGLKAVWAGVALVFAVLALGPVLHINGQTVLLSGNREIALPYRRIGSLPFINIMRSISRLDVIVMLALGVLAGAGLNAVVRRVRAGWTVGVFALGLVLFEFLPVPYPLSAPDTPEWYKTIAQDGRTGAVLNLPMNWDRPGYLLYQTEHRKPLTAAYISREDPRTMVERAPVLQHFRHLGPDIIDIDLSGQGQQVLAGLDVRWVVLDRYKMPSGAEREVTEALAGEIFAGREPAYADERLTVYEVANEGPQEPYLVLGTGWGPFDPATNTRTLGDSATVIVMAPAAGVVTVEVTLTGNEARRFDVRLAAERGANTLRLAAPAGGAAAVSGLRIK